MEEKLKPLARNDRKRIYAPALAKKYDCSESYVRSVIVGERESNTELSQAIRIDANDIVAIYERDTKELLINKQK